MKKNSVDKRKNKPLSKEVRVKYEAIVIICRNTKEDFKKRIADREALNNRCRTAIDHYRDILKEIEGAGKKLIDPDQEAKEAMEDIAHDVAFTLAMISGYKADILCNKEIIKIARQQALVYWRHEKKYRGLLSTTN